MNRKYAVGVDVGGSHISSILVDLMNGSVIERSYAESKLNNQADAQEIFQIWGKNIMESISHVGVDHILGIGFAMPGPFDYERGIALLKDVAKYDKLYGLNIGEELKKVLNLPDKITFRYINDALSFAIGETWRGKAAQFENVVAITLGTGFGSAFIENGVPVIEGNHVPPMGYVYNIPYRKGIADDHFSTRWFLNEYENRSGKKCKGVKEIAERSDRDNTAHDLFIDFGKRLGEFLSPILRTFDATCLVLGGNISRAYDLFGPSFEEVLIANGIQIEIIISELMEMSAMAGSARLIDEDYWIKAQTLVSKI